MPCRLLLGLDGFNSFGLLLIVAAVNSQRLQTATARTAGTLVVKWSVLALLSIMAIAQGFLKDWSKLRLPSIILLGAVSCWPL